MLTLDRLTGILTRFSELRVGLVGDLFLDRYLEIEASLHETSIETGLEAFQVTRVRNSPGAMGTVMNNLAALGVGRLAPVTVIGDDGHGYDLLRKLEPLPLDSTHIVKSPDRMTPTYTKPLRRDAEGEWKERNRLDVRTRAPLSTSETALVCEHLVDVFESTDGLIVLDQVDQPGQGVVNPAVRETLQDLARTQPDKLIYVDSRSCLGRFPMAVLKGNQSEVTTAAGLADPAEAANLLASRTGRPVFCTCGSAGLLIATPDGRQENVAGFAVNGPVDIVGAGDSATGGIVLSLLAGASEVEAATIANLVASITVQQLGATGTASPEQVLARWREMP